MLTVGTGTERTPNPHAAGQAQGVSLAVPADGDVRGKARRLVPRPAPGRPSAAAQEAPGVGFRIETERRTRVVAGAPVETLETWLAGLPEDVDGRGGPDRGTVTGRRRRPR